MATKLTPRARTATSLANAERWERAALGCLLEAPESWAEAAGLHADQFSTDWHRAIFSAMCALHERNAVADIVSVISEVGDSVPVDFISGLVDGTVASNLPVYVGKIREAASDRKFRVLQEQLSHSSNGDRLPIVDSMRELLARPGDDQDYRRLFHTVEELENAQPLAFAIDQFLQIDGITLIGGLSGHGKTLMMLAMTRSILSGECLFGLDLFKVVVPAIRVLYLVPESSIGPFWSRVKLFQLEKYVRSDQLFIRTLSHPEQITLEDPRILRAAEGADVFLDTATRFMSGSENDVESTRPFANNLFQLLAAGARSITGAHHSPKGFETADRVTLENILRGSGDLGAMLSCAWGVRQVDAEQNRIYVANAKARDFSACLPFIIQGRPCLDERGSFETLIPPGEAAPLREYLKAENENKDKGGRPAMPDKDTKVRAAGELRAATNLSVRGIAAKLGISKSTAERLLFQFDLSQKRPNGTQFRDKAESRTEVGGEASPKDFPTSVWGSLETVP